MQYQEVDTQYHRLHVEDIFNSRLSDSPCQRSNSQSPPLFQTEPDKFGLYWIYQELPENDPDQQNTVASVADAPTFIRETFNRKPTAGFGPSGNTDHLEWFFPFHNPSVFCLMNWYHCSTSLLLQTLNGLVNNVILAPDFDQADFEGFEASQEAHRLDNESIQKHSQPLPFNSGDHWVEEDISVPLPLPGKR